MRNRRPDRNADAARDAALEAKYRGAVSLVEIAYRQYLKLLKLELEQMGIQDISNVQSIGLFNIGTGEKAIGDLDKCHSGWTVHYNARELVKKGYLVRRRSPNDGRSRRVKLSEKGDALRDRLSEMHHRHLEQLRQTSIAEADLRATAATLLRLE